MFRLSDDDDPYVLKHVVVLTLYRILFIYIYIYARPALFGLENKYGLLLIID